MLPTRSHFRHCALFSLLIILAGFRGQAFDPESGDFSPEEPRDIRMVSYNVQRNLISSPSRTDEFTRILTALQPDILHLQEIVPTEVTSQALLNFIQGISPNPGNAPWHIHRGRANDIQNVILSRYPLSLQREDTTPPSARNSLRGVTMALIDLPDDEYTHDIYAMNIHHKCCSDGVDERIQAADAIMSWMDDAQKPGGNITLAPNTPMVIFGDSNQLASRDPVSLNTMITGDIQDEATFGPDVNADWDGTSIIDLRPRDPYTNDDDTHPSNTSNPRSQFDRFFYTDSAVEIGARFIFNPQTMTSAQRAAAGVFFFDAENAADHLPVVVDLRINEPETNFSLSYYRLY